MTGMMAFMSLICMVWRVPETTSSPWALIRKSPSMLGLPLETLRVVSTPVPLSWPMLPKTMVQMLTAVPRSWAILEALR